MQNSVKVGLNGLGVSAVVMKCFNIHDAMDGNGNFPSPNPDLVTYLAAVNRLGDAQSKVMSEGGKNNTVLRDVALSELRRLTSQLATYVNNVGNGDEEILLSSGFELRAQPAPVGVLPPPNDIRLTAEGIPLGSVRLYHRGNPKRKTYHYQCREYKEGAGPEAGWLPLVTSTDRSYMFAGLIGGLRYQFRVRVESTAGVGSWSQFLTLRPQ